MNSWFDVQLNQKILKGIYYRITYMAQCDKTYADLNYINALLTLWLQAKSMHFGY